MLVILDKFNKSINGFSHFSSYLTEKQNKKKFLFLEVSLSPRPAF